ncbi:hypothetical protein MCP1_130104 [Candidatus Terasakiella magnetica]|nr:hypothetical protein MCP1_130104 [Candidatus Terasakiella magnetica]
MAHKSLILLAYSPRQTIAKVGVEGSNPFARSNWTNKINAILRAGQVTDRPFAYDKFQTGFDQSLLCGMYVEVQSAPGMDATRTPLPATRRNTAVFHFSGLYRAAKHSTVSRKAAGMDNHDR